MNTNTNTTTTVTVSTRNFELAHGRKPRGFGNWAFSFSNNAAMGYYADGRELIDYTHNCTYSVAKKWAVVRAKQLGTTQVSVCS